MSKKMYRQGGWLASFVVVATVLVLALLGTVYYLKTRQNQTQNTASETSKTQSNNSSDTSNTTPSPSEDVNKSKPQTADTNSSNNSSTSNSSSSQNQNTKTSSSSDTSKLPETGPTNAVKTSIIVSILAFSIASYLASRRRAWL